MHVHHTRSHAARGPRRAVGLAPSTLEWPAVRGRRPSRDPARWRAAKTGPRGIDADRLARQAKGGAPWFVVCRRIPAAALARLGPRPVARPAHPDAHH